MRFTKLFSLVTLIAVLQSCINKPGCWKNEQISASKRADFHSLNDQAFKYLKANDANQLSFLESSELGQDRYNTRLINEISNNLNADNYTLFDEYYVINKYKAYDTIRSAAPGMNNYLLVYPGETHEMYIALFAPKTGVNKNMITLIYSKYNYGWKISSLDEGPYTFNGKTSPELFELGKTQYAEKHLVGAANTMDLANSCLHPASIWQYPNETDISSLYSRVTYEANKQYHFPFIIQQVATHPRIIRVFNQSTSGGYYPDIYYLSSIKLKDTAAIKKENERIQKVIGGLIPGIDKDNKHLVYTVFNEMPNIMKTVDRFEIDVKL